MSQYLPVEVISTILHYIDQQHIVYQVALVSRHYYTATVRHLWRFPRSNDSNRLLACLQTTNQQLGELVRTLQFGHDEALDTVLGILKHTPELETVRFMTTLMLIDSTFSHLAQSLIHITHLSLCYVSLTHLGPIGHHCTNLHDIALVSCPDLTPTVFADLINVPLEHIRISDCHWLTATDTAHDLARFDLITLELEDCGRTDAKFIACLSRFPRLERFSIVGDVGFQWWYQSDVNHSVVQPFLLAHPGLRTLKLKFCTIDDATLATIASSLPELRELSLRGCAGLSPRAVRQMVMDTCLTALDVGGTKIEARWFPESGNTRYIGLLSRPCLDLIRAHPNFILLD